MSEQKQAPAGTFADGIEAAALDAARNELERLLFNQPSETTHKIIDQINAALKGRPTPARMATEDEAQRGLNDTWPGDPYP